MGMVLEIKIPCIFRAPKCITIVWSWSIRSIRSRLSLSDVITNTQQIQAGIIPTTQWPEDGVVICIILICPFETALMTTTQSTKGHRKSSHHSSRSQSKNKTICVLKHCMIHDHYFSLQLRYWDYEWNNRKSTCAWTHCGCQTRR